MNAISERLGYLHQVWQFRRFWLALVQCDLRNRYKGSFLGLGWSLLRPLVMTITLCLVFGKVFNVSFADYAPYLLLGITTWQFLTESIHQGCQSFTQGAPYIRQQPVPLAIFPLRTVLGSGTHFLIALTLAIALTMFFRGSINPLTFLALVPSLLILFLLCWCLAIVSGVLHAHFPDTVNLLELMLQLAFYVTPILYRPEDIGRHARVALLVDWNPFTSVLALVRTPILEGAFPAVEHMGISLLFLAVVGVVASLLLRKLERTLVFWI